MTDRMPDRKLRILVDVQCPTMAMTSANSSRMRLPSGNSVTQRTDTAAPRAAAAIQQTQSINVALIITEKKLSRET